MSLPIIDVSQMRAWERSSWAVGKSETEVIRRAGEATARKAENLTQPGDSILIVAGKGHNGDDARLAGQAVQDRRILLLNVTTPRAQQQQLLNLLGERPALLVDGLFGIGLNRPLDADWLDFIDRINQSGCPVLAVDVPSGLNADSGVTFGDAIRATVTLTMGTVKVGLLAAEAWPYVGRLEVATEIGLIPCPYPSDRQWLIPDDFRGFPPRRSVEGHKGTFGHVLIIAGSLGYHGAAVLAARGALRARPGLVTVWTMDEAYIPVASQLQAAMVHPWRADLEPPPSTTAIVAGPGLAAVNCPNILRERIAYFWTKSPLPMLADASALACLPANDPERTVPLRVITPHPGEAARLLNLSTHQVQIRRPAALRELSHKYGGSWVVLKGHQSLIGRHPGICFVNSTGNPELAQGGSGDLLAGYLGGLLAQPRFQGIQAENTLCYGVWRHGQAADQLQSGCPCWTIEDLARTI